MKRELNILSRAVNDGFIVNQNETFEAVISLAQDYLIEASEIDEYVEVKIVNNTVYYEDAHRWFYESSGEFYTIEDFKRAIRKGATTLEIDKIINTNAEIISLFITL